MFKFDPDTLYSIDELREGLRGLVELPTFLDRLGLRDKRVFKGAIWGWEVIAAAQQAEQFSETGKTNAAIAAVNLIGQKRSTRTTPMISSPTRKLSAKDMRD